MTTFAVVQQFATRRGGYLLWLSSSTRSANSAATTKRTIALSSRRCFATVMNDSSSGSSSSSTTTAITDYTPYLSPLSQRRQPSAIRKLMPLMAQKGMVSLGGGLPNPSMFPFESFEFTAKNPHTKRVSKLQLDSNELNAALQYSPTPGLPALVQQLQELQKQNHGGRDDYPVAVTVGSQDGLVKAFEMLLDPTQDELLVEDPTYSGALAFLHPFGVKLTPVQTDKNGMNPQALEQALVNGNNSSRRRRVLYTIPTAQNPSGSTLSNARRHEIYALAQQHDILIVEDDPYYFLHPNRSSLTSFMEMDTDGRVIRFDSLSKLISSGIRIGFATGPAPLMERLNYHMQATNLHNSGISQAIVAKLLQDWGLQDGFEQHTEDVAAFYSQRGQVLAAAAQKHLKDLAEWSVPEAGMFFWINLACSGITDTKALIENKAAKANVLLVPGQSFCPLNQKSSYVRASFSTASDQDMYLAMERLANLIKSESQTARGRNPW